jgi:hypothetical protein
VREEIDVLHIEFKFMITYATLKQTLQKQGVRMWTGFSWLRTATGSGAS